MRRREFCGKALCPRAAPKLSRLYFTQPLREHRFSGSQETLSLVFYAKRRHLALKPAGRCAVSRRYAYRDVAVPGTAALRQRAIRNWPLFAIFSTGVLDHWLPHRDSWSFGQSLLPLC